LERVKKQNKEKKLNREKEFQFFARQPSPRDGLPLRLMVLPNPMASNSRPNTGFTQLKRTQAQPKHNAIHHSYVTPCFNWDPYK
jgi:hypothetical protein